MTKAQGRAGRTRPGKPELVSLPVSRLVLDPDNVRLHSERNIEAIASSLERFGQQKPIVIDKKNIVRAGNGTVLAARRLAWETIVCVVTTLRDPEEIRAFAIADNRLSDLSEFDEEKLAIELTGLAESNLLSATGFDDDELDDLNALLAPSLPGPKRKLNGFHNVPVVRIVIGISKLETFERAMQVTGEMNRETALMRIAEAYLAANEKTERQLHH